MKKVFKSVILCSIASFAVLSCQKEQQQPLEQIYEGGIYAVVPTPECGDSESTKGIIIGTDHISMDYSWIESSDAISVFTDEAGEAMIYAIKIVKDEPKKCLFNVNNFTLKEDLNYYGFYPQNTQFSKAAQPLDYTNQVQAGLNNGGHLSAASYMYAGFANNTFSFSHLSSWITAVITSDEDVAVKKVVLSTTTEGAFLAKGTASADGGAVTTNRSASSLEVVVENEGSSNILAAGTTGYVYFAVRSLKDMDNLTVTVYDENDNSFSRTIGTHISKFTPGKYYNVKVSNSNGHVAKVGDVIFDTLADAIAAATSGQTIALLTDIVDAGNINLQADVTLDGNGHKLSGNSAVYINAAGGAVKNVVFENIHNAGNNLSAVYARELTGTASVSGCSFDNCDWDAIQVTPKNGSKLEIVDNTFKHTNTEGSQLRYVHIEGSVIKSPYTSAEITVTDNRFYNTKASGVDAINNIGAYYISYATAGAVKYSGNWFETIKNCDIKNSSADYGYYVYPARSQADVDVDDIQPAARSVVKPFAYYDTLQQAFESGNDIMLMKNTEADATVPASYNKQLQTDVFRINSTITNNGALYIIASISDEACTGKIINKGSLKSSNLSNLNGLQIVNNGKFEITGSTNAADLSKITNNAGGIIEISGGKYNAKPADEWILWGYEAVDNGDGTFSVQKRTFANDEEALAAGAVVKCTSSTNVFKDYINTLANGGTNYLHFLKDITENVVRTSTTYLCADGFKYIGRLDATGQKVYVKSGKTEFNSLSCTEFHVGATGTEGVEVTVHDGAVTAKITVYSPAVLRIDGGTFTKNSTSGASYVVAVNNGASLIITGGTFKSEYFKPFIADGYTSKDNGDGTWTVVEMPEGGANGSTVGLGEWK